MEENNNPFTGMEVIPQPTQETSALVEVEQQRAIAETQAAMVIAKRFPRNQAKAMDRILNACTRPGLADSALYQYARGGTEITGPSIRLAEAIAQNWENLQFGIRELDQKNGASTVEAFAWDVENNVRQVKIFQVAHKRYTKKGAYKLEDPRDIYEMVANQGARRLRACILGIIPGDVIEAATKQCEDTLKVKAAVTPERIASLIDKFSEYGVSKGQIEKRIQRRIDAITPALMVNLGKIYNSMKDGMSVAGDWFEIEESKPTQTSGIESLKDKLMGGDQNGGIPHVVTEQALLEEIRKARPASGKGAAENYRSLILGKIAILKELPEVARNNARAKWDGANLGPWPLDTPPIAKDPDVVVSERSTADFVDCPREMAGVGITECQECKDAGQCQPYQEYVYEHDTGMK